MSTTRVSLSMHSWLSLYISFLETKMTLLSEWVKILVISFSELSGRMGIATRPKAAAEKKASVQLGIFCDNIATLSPALMPKRDILIDSMLHFSPKLA